PILCYLHLIRETFIHLMGANSDLLSLVDGVTVRLLRSRAPKVSDTDFKFLERRMNLENVEVSEADTKDEILFRDIEDPDLRHSIWNRLKSISYPIPTLESFFKDRLWLEVGQNVMQQLIAPDLNPSQRSTIDESLGELYNTSVPMSIPFRQHHIRSQLFELWRFSLQYGFEMTGPAYHRRLPRTGRRSQHRRMPGLTRGLNVPDQSILWQYFFWLAKEQNFDISVAEGFQIGPAQLPSIMACDYPEDGEEDVTMGRRHGKPYTDSADADCFALSQDALSEPWVAKQSTANSVTAGFVRRSVFEAFFSYLKAGSLEWPVADSPSPGIGNTTEMNLPGESMIGEPPIPVLSERNIRPAAFAPTASSAPFVEQCETPTAMQSGDSRPSFIVMKFYFLDQSVEERSLTYLEPFVMNRFFERLSTKFIISNPGRNNRTLPGSSCCAHYDSNNFSPLHATWRFYILTGSEEPGNKSRKRRREGGSDELIEAKSWLENELGELAKQ
ncbi:unnamed protein product, partial [Penicillium salamii]